MQIKSTDKVAGYPVMLMRKLLRQASGSRFEGYGLLQIVLDVDEQVAAAVFETLVADGYLLVEESGSWTPTVLGNSLAYASAALPLHRVSADVALRSFLRRVQKSFAGSYYLYEVDSVVLFGSYLSSAARISDIDVALTLRERTLGDRPAFLRRCDARAADAVDAGRHLLTQAQQYCWPKDELLLYLKNRKRSLSFVDFESDHGVVCGGPHVTLWEHGQFVIGSIPLLADAEEWMQA